MSMTRSTNESLILPHLRSLQGSDRSALLHTIERSSFPARAATAITTIAETHPELVNEVLTIDEARVALVTILAASRSLGVWLQSRPDEVRRLASPEAIAPLPPADELRELAQGAIARSGDPADQLRHFRRRWFCQIALRDLLALATLEEVCAALANLADACLHAAITIATDAEPDRLAVVAMGKLGGQELNYASDVDVLFISPEGEDDAGPARRVMAIMSEPSSGGIVWRVDADLRPEGRSGRLVRSLPGYLAYYERWADTWEFQALIKRRPGAGNLELARQFCQQVDGYVWPDSLPRDALDDLRDMKAQAEAKVAAGGRAEREVKLGPGGIRDIEFAVQLLQLVHGRRDPDIRSPNTLNALMQLSGAGYVAPRDAELLSTAYRKLRAVEHRLQLENESQVHTLPTDVARLDHLGRTLGYKPDGESTVAERFLDDFRTDVATVRSVHERLFYRPLLEAFTGLGPAASLTEAAAEDRLRAFGFVNAAATRRALEDLTTGISRRSKLMEATLPLVLGWLSDSPDPDLGLLLLDRLSSERHRADTLTAMFRESPLAAQRLCTLLGTSRLIGEGLEHFPELLLLLEDDHALAQTRSRESLTEGALRQLAWRGDIDERKAGLRRFVRRERTRIGMRDMLGFADVDEVAAELSALAEACLEAGLRTVTTGRTDLPPIAVIGLGRLGGANLSYGSDLDILVVYGEDVRKRSSAFEEVEKVVVDLIDTVAARTADGWAFDIDLDLRPEGRYGVLARNFRGYKQYWERWAQTWELQALTRARPVAGDPELGRQFIERAERYAYVDPFPEARLADIRVMKARIERERLPSGTDPAFHMKLGRGGTVEIEFAIQLLQLRHGARTSALQTPSIRKAIETLVEEAVISGDVGDCLDAGYVLINQIRNRLWLLGVQNIDTLPTDFDHLSKLARSLGYHHHPAPSLREDYRRVTRLAHRAADGILYPEGPSSWR